MTTGTCLPSIYRKILSAIKWFLSFPHSSPSWMMPVRYPSFGLLCPVPGGLGLYSPF